MCYTHLKAQLSSDYIVMVLKLNQFSFLCSLTSDFKKAINRFNYPYHFVTHSDILSMRRQYGFFCVNFLEQHK